VKVIRLNYKKTVAFSPGKTGLALNLHRLTIFFVKYYKPFLTMNKLPVELELTVPVKNWR